VFAGVAEAMERPAPTCRCCSSRRPFAKAPSSRPIDAQIPLAVVITEGIPVQDSAWFWQYSQGKGTRHHRPELPRPDQPRQEQRRHHPGDRSRRRPAASAWSARAAR
jgi:succinyl-CoA synthetase alpha subunit